MAYSPANFPYTQLRGHFQEHDHKQWFDYALAEENPFNMPHMVFVGGFDGSQTRYANVLKTVAYVVTDEDENGKPVIEKWHIKHQWRKE